MRTLFMLILLLVTMKPLAAQDAPRGQTTAASFESQTLGRAYDYYVYLPAGYDEQSDQRYPVLYLLHGRGDDYFAWLNGIGVLDKLIAAGDIPPLIAIMPDMPSSKRASYFIDSAYTGADFSAEPVETAFFSDLIPHIDASYPTITKREGRVIGGYSMGGYGALRYALAHPDTFIGAIVLSPAVYTPQPPQDSSTRLFGAFGVGDTLFDETRYTELNYPALFDSFVASDLALYMFIAVGDDEWKNPTVEDQYHDIDMEAHLLYNRARRWPKLLAELRVYDGGHDWDVWRRGFEEGLRYVSRFLAK